MPRMITTCLALLLAMAPGAWTAAAAGWLAATVVETRAQADSLTGTWALTVTTSQGTGTPTVTLTQDGAKLSGTYSSQVFGEQQVTGSVKGSEFTFTFTGDVQGTSLVVTYTGTAEKDTMKGKVTLGDMGEGTFTGSRK